MKMGSNERNLYSKNIEFAKNPKQARQYFGNWVRSEGKRGVKVVAVKNGKYGEYIVHFIRVRPKQQGVGLLSLSGRRL
jgi:hypothetical protein